MKALMTILIVFTGMFLQAAEVTDEMKAKVASETEQRDKIIKMFNEKLAMKVNQGDKEAVQLAKESQANAGKVIIEFERMKKLMLKWDSASVAEFKKLPTKDEVILVVKDQFQSLLQKKVDAKDTEALKLAEQGKRNGRIDLSVGEMKEYITKWSKK